eukprot:TRINITY_DN1146_c0_g1_i1.p1 TRINITY_DN1146_c0_g1~~TRINITY_DN1146_c0_g1_i1.p1  ORF type:complete len:149 (-),score=36.10 TRINITY_DN1146_c0_g1_i1:81-527(-)
MGRRGGGRSRSAPRAAPTTTKRTTQTATRTSSSTKAPAAKKTDNKTTQSNQNTQNTSTPNVGGGGFMQSLGASMAGSFLGNMLARSLFGGHGGAEGAEQQEVQLLNEDQPCHDLQMSLLQCLQSNEDNFSVCEWPAKSYQSCYEQNYD